jgi:hypothetical protein
MGANLFLESYASFVFHPQVHHWCSIEQEEKAPSSSRGDKEGARFARIFDSLLSRNLKDFSKVPGLQVEDGPA